MMNTAELVHQGRQANGHPLLSALYPGRFEVSGPFSVQYTALHFLTEWIGGDVPHYSGWNKGREHGSLWCWASFPVLLTESSSSGALFPAWVCGQIVLTDIPGLPSAGVLAAISEEEATGLPDAVKGGPSPAVVWRRKATMSGTHEAEDAGRGTVIVLRDVA